MRRFVASVLALLFLSQAPASASVGPISAPNAAPLLSMIQSTWIFAVVTGTTNRYAAMHAPQPVFPHLPGPGIRPNPARTRTIPGVVVPGGLGHAVRIFPDVLPSNAQPDPLAMPRTSAQMRGTMNLRRTIVIPQGSTMGVRRAMTAPTPAPTSMPLTGINPWWRYQEKALPGVGKAIVNVGTANMLVQANDVAVRARGIDLVFSRVYNSLSGHDVTNTDGSVQSNYGDGWTNTFDAHLGYNSTTNVMSVYDMDGARYDYVSDNQGNWYPPAGQHATLTLSGNGCGLVWTKVDGSSLSFWRPVAACGTPQAYWGRLCTISARNHKNYIVLNYSWTDGTGNAGAEPTQISAVHSDTQSLTLAFTRVNGHEELHTITRADGATVTYEYTGTNLTKVDRPGNNVASTLYDVYQYYPNGHLLQVVESPRYVRNNNDGAYVGFAYDSSNRITTVADYASVNFTPNDGTGAPLQSGTGAPGQGIAEWYYEVFNGWGTGQTNMGDTSGHGGSWVYDSSGRVTQTSEWTGVNNLSLVTNAFWDTNNNVTSTIDAAGNTTNYGYDASGTNLLWVQAPPVQTNLGSGQAVTRYAYDSANNLVASCDAQTLWKSGASACVPGPGATTYKFNTSDSSEPAGCLTDVIAPNGYDVTISYPQTASPCDDGLPTSIAGAPFSQLDGSPGASSLFLSYDGYGNILSVANSTGTTSYRYDCDNTSACANNQVSKTDADNHVSTTTYFQDGSIATQQSPAQAHAGVSNQFGYDADGNVVSETTFNACTSACAGAQTQRFFDGDDRLVEVALPHDTLDLYTYSWMTRYLYDITAGGAYGTVALGNGMPSVTAHGNLFEKQLYFAPGASGQVVPGSLPGGAASSFWASQGTAYDSLNREIATYDAGGTSPATPVQSLQYDTPDNTGKSRGGFLASESNGVGQSTQFVYDNVGQILASIGSDGVSFSYLRDPDERPRTVTQGNGATETIAYDDVTGDLISDTTPAYGAETSPTTTSYSYYPNGKRSGLGLITGNGGVNNSSLISYDYRADGLLAKQAVALNGNKTFSYTYSPAGRLMQMFDPTTGGVTPAGTAQSARAAAATSEQISQGYGLPTQSLAASTTLAAQIRQSAATTQVASGATSSSYLPTTFGYDATGQLNSEELPTGQTYSNIRHDLQGAVTSFQAYGGLTIQNTLNNRGELLGQHYFQGTNLATDWPHFGLLPSLGYLAATSDNTPPGIVNLMQFQQLDNRTANTQQFTSAGQLLQGYSFQPDYAGRQATSRYQAPYYVNPQTGAYFSGVASRSFDSRDNLKQWSLPANDPQNGQSVYGWPALGTNMQIACNQAPSNSLNYYSAGTSIAYQYNAQGRVVSGVGSFPGNAASSKGLHWDGSSALFSTNASGKVDFIRIGLQALIDPSGSVTMTDRDWHGSLVEERTASGYSAWSPVDPHLQGCVPSAPPAGAGTSPTATPAFAQLSPDTVTDGFNFFAGVRSYDPTASQWTSMDASSGDPSDPVSQTPYTFNHNNPGEFSDPSGMIAFPGDPIGGGWNDPIGGEIPVLLPTNIPGLGIETNPADGVPAMSYRELLKIKFPKSWNIQRHHLVTQELLKLFDINPRTALSKAIPHSLHVLITNAWNNEIKGMRARGSITAQAVQDAARRIQQMFPTALRDTEAALSEFLERLPSLDPAFDLMPDSLWNLPLCASCPPPGTITFDMKDAKGGRAIGHRQLDSTLQMIVGR